MGESGQAPGRWDPSEYWKGGIRASTRKVGFGRVPERWDPGEYRKSGIRASTEKVGYWRVPERWDPSEKLENPRQAKRSKQTQGKGVGPSMTSRVC